MQAFTHQARLRYYLKGLIISNGKIYTSGTSMTTQPVEKDMHYRIGGQGITILTTLFLILVDKGYFKLNDVISNYVPNVPNGKLITLQMLCNMTSGLEDVIKNPLVANADVFKQWSTRKLLDIIIKTPPLYPPGERFYFGHITNMLLLGKALQIGTKTSLKDLLSRYIFDPLHLKNTFYIKTQTIPHPLHSFSAYRVNMEDATFWNSSWASYPGRLLSNAHDMFILAKAMGSGQLISKKLYNIQMSNPFNQKGNYYGMGCAITTINHYKTIWSNANLNGYIGMWAYNKKGTYVIQTNTDNLEGFEANKILQELLN